MDGACAEEHSTGGKAKLFGISNRGNRYLRKMTMTRVFPPRSAQE